MLCVSCLGGVPTHGCDELLRSTAYDAAGVKQGWSYRTTHKELPEIVLVVPCAASVAAQVQVPLSDVATMR
jgi:hypothetical protein